jgi:hypothetical protein
MAAVVQAKTPVAMKAPMATVRKLSRSWRLDWAVSHDAGRSFTAQTESGGVLGSASATA